MEKLIVACIQQRMRLPATADEYKEDLRRFLRATVNKRARLAIFPELAGTMLVPPQLRGTHANLFKQMDQARRRQASLWQKTRGSMAGIALRLLRLDLRNLMAGLLDVAGPQLWQSYLEMFGGLAREFDLTLVAPSGYFPDPLDGVIRNLSAVFGPDGALMGYQAKGVLHPEDGELAQPGSEWRIINTDVGRMGIMLGGDMLYPEVGRLLAYQGAEMLIGQAAATDRAFYEKLRTGMLARMQENQLFGAISFLVGTNEFGSRQQRDPFMGKSAIFAPQELTPQSSGILVEMSNVRSESVLAAVWDFPALQTLWQNSDTPMRRGIPVEGMAPLLAEIYQQIKQLPLATGGKALPQPEKKPDERVVHLDDLPVLSSVTARWPLPAPLEPIDEAAEQEANPLDSNSESAFLRSARNQPGANAPTEVEEETQEMDALLKPEESQPEEDKPSDDDTLPASRT